jgi:hypothetical protein
MFASRLKNYAYFRQTAMPRLLGAWHHQHENRYGLDKPRTLFSYQGKTGSQAAIIFYSKLNDKGCKTKCPIGIDNLSSRRLSGKMKTFETGFCSPGIYLLEQFFRIYMQYQTKIKSYP